MCIYTRFTYGIAFAVPNSGIAVAIVAQALRTVPTNLTSTSSSNLQQPCTYLTLPRACQPGYCQAAAAHGCLAASP